MYYKIKRPRILIVSLKDDKDLFFKKASVIQKKGGIVDSIIQQIDTEVI